MALGEGPHDDAPPGLTIPAGAPGAYAKAELGETNVSSICEDVNQRADELLQDKVDQIMVLAADQLQTSFNKQQEQMAAELQSCREKVKTLEADKKEMQQTVTMMQEQLAALTGQMMRQQFGWPTQGQGPTGGFVNAGMMGPFSTLPSGMPFFPNIPSFPGSEQDGQASEPSTMAPPSPQLSAPPTPSRRTSAPPCLDAWHMLPPPGLPVRATPTPSPFGTPSMGPCNVPPPPGLEESLLDELLPTEPSAKGRISLSDAIDAPELATQVKPKAAEDQARRSSLEESERQALKFMQSHKDTDDSFDRFMSPKVTPKQNPLQFLSPKPSEFLSPKVPRGQLGGTPSRTDSQLGGTPSRNIATGLNLTPKRTPRRSFGTPGMRSPAISASPFVICEGGGTVFGFTIRKADDCTLGVDFKDSDCGSCLQVTCIKPGGALQAWNKLCVGGPAAGKAVMPGDKIVKVNEITTPQDMLRECREQKLLKITVQRGEVDDDVDPLSIGSSTANRPANRRQTN